MCSCRSGEITGVLLEALILVFGVLCGDAMRTADLAQRLNNLFAIELEMICHRQEQVFGRQVVVAKISACLVSALEGLDQLPGLLDVAAECLWKGLQLFVEPVSNNHRLLTHPLQDGQHHTIGLTDERQQQVLGRYLWVRFGLRELLGCNKAFASLLGPLIRVDCHVRPPSK